MLNDKLIIVYFEWYKWENYMYHYFKKAVYTIAPSSRSSSLFVVSIALVLFSNIQYYLFRNPNLCLNTFWENDPLFHLLLFFIHQSVNIHFSSLSDQ